MALPIHTRLQKLRQFPPGRASRAAHDVIALALPLGYAVQLHPFADAVHSTARIYIDRRALRFGQSEARGEGEARKIDKPVDVRLGFIHDTARRWVADLPGTPEAEAGARLLKRYFPRGLRAFVRAPYEEELIQLEAMLDGLAGDDAELPALLHIEHHVAALRALAPKYAAALRYRDKVTPGELAQAWRAVHVSVIELVCAIITVVRDEARRVTLLAPIFEHDDQLAAIYARRQRGQSVDDADVDLDLEAIEEADRTDADLDIDAHDDEADRAAAEAADEAAADAPRAEAPADAANDAGLAEGPELRPLDAPERG